MFTHSSLTLFNNERKLSKIQFWLVFQSLSKKKIVVNVKKKTLDHGKPTDCFVLFSFFFVIYVYVYIYMQWQWLVCVVNCMQTTSLKIHMLSNEISNESCLSHFCWFVLKGHLTIFIRSGHNWYICDTILKNYKHNCGCILMNLFTLNVALYSTLVFCPSSVWLEYRVPYFFSCL